MNWEHYETARALQKAAKRLLQVKNSQNHYVGAIFVAEKWKYIERDGKKCRKETYLRINFSCFDSSSKSSSSVTSYQYDNLGFSKISK